MTNPILEDRIRRYILETFLYTRPDYPLGGEESLLGNGIIDSMGVMELVGFLQAEVGVSIGDEQITEENLGSVNAIVAFVGRRLPVEATVLA